APGPRPLLRRLHRTAHRPPAHGDPPAAGQGRRVGVHPRRRPRLQAAELDEPALHPQGRARRHPGRQGGDLDGHQQGRRAADHHDRDRRARPLPGPRRRPGPAEGRRRGRAAAAARAARGDLRRGLVARPPGVPDRDRTGRPALPRRRGRRGGRGDQAARGDRRRRAAHPVPGAAQPGPAAGAGQGRVRRAGDQAAGAGPGRRPGDRLPHRRLRRPQGHRRPVAAPLL
ncbi:MAG: Endonuclease NucS, partial [uncultured Pseudonocardia sp.]